MAPLIFEMVENFNMLLPQTNESFNKYPPKAHIDMVNAFAFGHSYKASDNKVGFKNNPINLKVESDSNNHQVVKIEEDKEII